MTIPRKLGRRVGYYSLIWKMFVDTWKHVRRERGRVEATAAVFLSGFLLYMVLRQFPDPDKGIGSTLGER